MLKDFSVSALVAGFVSVLVGFTSSVAIIFQATQALGATPDQTASWLWAIGVGMALPTFAFSILTRKPILIAWSTPGAAVIGAAAAAGHLTMPQAIGCFLFSAVLIMIAGFSGGFEKIMKRLPLPLASALLAGVLARFALDAFIAVPGNPLLVLSMAAAYVAGRRCWPRANIPLVLVLGIAIAAAQGLLHLEALPWKITTPVWTSPESSLPALIGTGIPLFIVTMASQNLPGIAAIRVGGYEAPVSQIIGWTGVTNLLFAPFGAFGINLAAITAAFCVGPEAHPDPARPPLLGPARRRFLLSARRDLRRDRRRPLRRLPAGAGPRHRRPRPADHHRQRPRRRARRRGLPRSLGDDLLRHPVWHHSVRHRRGLLGHRRRRHRSCPAPEVGLTDPPASLC
jgi:benzoate membrane transport protein